MPSNQELLTIVNDTASLVGNIEPNIALGVESWSSTWSTYLQIFYSEFDSMRSVIQLLSSGKYKDCFTLLRTVFEYYFLLLLMIRGKKYRDSRKFYVETEGSTTARDETYAKWMADWRSGKPAYSKFKAIDKGHESDVIYVTFETEGLYQSGDAEKKGDVVPVFYFAFDEYDPDVHFLAGLDTVDKQGLRVQDIVDKHKHLYSHFLSIDRIATNLSLNDLLTQEQLDRFWVHYNYLSAYTHPTTRGVESMDSFTYSMPAYGRTDSVAELVVLCYVAHFQVMLIELITTFFSEKNPKASLSAYQSQAEKLKNIVAEFWFIYNDPTPFDVTQSDLTKSWIKMRSLPVPSGVLYYTDPIDRMRRISAQK